MVWFNNLALAKKLAIAFGLCTLITLGIGAVGMKGIGPSIPCWIQSSTTTFGPSHSSTTPRATSSLTTGTFSA